LYTIILWNPSALYVASVSIYATATKDIFLAVPFFVFMATLLEHTGIAEDLFDIIYKFLPELRGGLAIGTIAMCTIIAAMTGLGGTGVVTIGAMALPEMLKRGYDKRLALGCIPAGGSLGPLIPPSVIMVLIAGLTGLSVGKLFAAGMIPGLIMSALFIAYILLRCVFQPRLAPTLPPEERLPWKSRIISLKGIFLPALLVVSVLGSIYSGMATPTEAAGVGAGGAALCGVINRRLTWANVKKAMISALRINCMVMWLLIGGSMFGAMLSATGISQLTGSFIGASQSPNFAVLIMMIIPMFLGCFIDGGAITVVCIPIFWPIVTSLGIDPYWFGTLFTINMIAGYLTPPFGMNLFYTKGIAPPETSMTDIYLGAYPFNLMQLIVLVIVFFFPNLATWLPSIMG
jgi:tripartite ATP-independent transporter DctM subunit